MNRLKKKDIDEKMQKAVKQGFIFIRDISREIVKCTIEGWDKKHRCVYVETKCGIDIPIFAKDYGGNSFWQWALTREELE